MLNFPKMKSLIENKNVNQLVMYSNKDLKNLPLIISYLSNIDSINMEELTQQIFNMKSEIDKSHKVFLLQIWLLAILTNPFDFLKILNLDDKMKIYNFLCINVILEKLAVKICVRILDLDLLLAKQKFTQWLIIKEYSKISILDKHIIDYIVDTLDYSRKGDLYIGNCMVPDTDDETTKIYKFKILSYQDKYTEINPNIFYKYMNYDNFKFGYSLCRSFLRIIKFYDVQSIVDHLTEQLDLIFANEMLWINTLHILGSLIFKKYKIRIQKEIIEKSINFNFDESNYRSVLIREYSLFLVYSMFRQGVYKEYIVNLLIYKLVLDGNYKIRSIASSILEEYFNLKLPVKRQEDIIRSFERISEIHKIDIRRYIEQDKIDIRTVELRNHILVKYKIFELQPLSKEKISDTINLSESNRSDNNLENGLSDCFQLTRLSVTENKLDVLQLINIGYFLKYSLVYKEDIHTKLLDIFFKADLKELYKFRFIDKLIEIYIEVLEMYMKKYGKKEEIENNLIFMISKNKPVHNIVWLMGNSEIYEYLFKMRRRPNRCIIISNMRNKKYSKEIICEYKSKIHENVNIDIIIDIYESIHYSEQLEIFLPEILMGLENYHIDQRGDISYKIRLASIKILREVLNRKQLDDHPLNIEILGMENKVITTLQQKEETLRLIYNIYIERYLVDKSKFIRDYISQNAEEVLLEGSQLYKLSKLKILSEFAIMESIRELNSLNVCVGVLAYLGTCDNYKFKEIMDLFIRNLEIYDACIRKLINLKYTRIYKYIYKVIDYLHGLNIKKYIFEWNELLKEYDQERYLTILSYK